MELALTFALYLACLVFGPGLARAAFVGNGSAGVRRVGAAIERATRSFSVRAAGSVAAVSGLVAAFVIALGASSGRSGAGIVSALGIAFGALLALGTALGAVWLGSRASSALTVRASARFDLTLTAALRTAGASGIVAQALSALGSLALLGIGRALYRPASGASASELAEHAALALPGYALGAALVAFVLRGTAGAYAGAARAGELRAIELDPAVARNENKNPALVSALVGGRLEHGVDTAMLFAACAAAVAAAAELGIGASAPAAVEPRVVALPLLLWGFGLVANGAGLLVARALEAQGATPALARGHASAAMVWCVGLVGGGYWLFPGAWPLLSGAGALGFVAAAAVAYATTRAHARRHGALREAMDGLQGGAAPAEAGALAFGLGHAALALCVLALAGLAAERLGAASGAAGGGELGAMLALFAAMSWAPYALAVSGGTALAEASRAVADMGSVEPEAQTRLQRVAESSQAPACIARSALTLACTLGALAPAAGLAALLARDPTRAESHTGWAGVAGAALVLSAAAFAARRAARAAREIAAEVARHVLGGPGEPPAEARPPSYRACEELAGRLGFRGVLGDAVTGIAGPVLLGIGLRLVYRESGPRLAAEALATWVAGAAVTALGVALAVDGARAVMAAARRANRPEGDPATHAASVTGSALAEIFGGAAGPAACTAALIAASMALLARTVFQ